MHTVCSKKLIYILNLNSNSFIQAATDRLIFTFFIQVAQTLDAEHYWLFPSLRHQIKKWLQEKTIQPGSSDFDDLKAVALIEYEEAVQVSHTMQ